MYINIRVHILMCVCGEYKCFTASTQNTAPYPDGGAVSTALTRCVGAAKLRQRYVWQHLCLTSPHILVSP